MNNKSKDILIVDDEQEITEKIKTILANNMDCKIDIAYNGKEAIDMMKARKTYDILILAILIPKLDGIEVCQEMVRDERLKKTSVLLISVLPLNSEAFQSSLNKFDEFSMVKDILEKPFSDKDLLVKVKKILIKTNNKNYAYTI